MGVIVEVEDLVRLKNTIKQLPVQGDFDVADAWVGCVLAIDKMLRGVEEQKNIIKEKKDDEASVTNE